MSNKSVEIEILLRETVAKGLKEAISSIREMDAASKQSTVNFKGQIAEQRQAIKQIESDIKNMIAARDKLTSTQAKSNANLDISAARRALAEEKDLLTKTQTAAAAANKNEEESQGGLIASLGKWAIGLATVTTAMKVGQAIIGSTKDTADQFQFSVDAAKSGLDQFWRTLATGDFSNFFDNMGKAIKAGYDFAEAMDKVKESSWAMEMNEADVQKKKYQLLEDIRNKQLTKDERIAKGEEYIKQEDDLAKKRTNNATLELNSYKKKAATISGLQEEEVVNTLKQVNETTRIKAEAYNKALEFSDSRRTNKTTEEYATHMPVLKNAQEEVKLYAASLRGVGKLKEEFIVGFVEAYKKVGNAEASGMQSSLRARTTLNGLKADIKKDEQDAAQKAKEDAELDNRIKATQELMKTASGERLKQLASEYIELVKQKNLNDQLIDQTIKLARNPDGTVAPALMKARGKAVSSIATPIIAGLQTSTATALPLARAREEERVEKLAKEAKLREDILYSASALTGILVQNGALSEEQGSAIQQTLDGFKSLASGDILGAAMNIVSQIASLFPTQAEEIQTRIDKINAALKEQQRLIELADRFGDEKSSRAKELDVLREKKKAAEEALANAERKRDNKIFKIGPVYKGYVKDVNDLTAALVESQNAIEDAELALQDFLSGGVTENTLADSIAQSFQDGKGSIDDFADYMNNVLGDAVMNIFKAEMLGPALTEVTKSIKAALEDKILTPKEKAAIDAQVKAVADANKGLWEDLTGSLNLGASSKSSKGMTADIKAITEESASQLVGTTNAMRLNIARLLDNNTTSMGMLQKSLEYQLRTADNTGEMKETLKEMNSRLSRFELDGIKVK